MKVSPLPQWNVYEGTYRSQQVMSTTGTVDKDLLMLGEEMEALYAQRPASLRVTESGKKERDPQYHCVMEKVRRRGQKMAIDRLKKALSEHPHGLSLQTALKAAVEEVATLKAKDNRQKSQIAEMKEKQKTLQRKMMKLRASIGSVDVSPPSPDLNEVEQTAEPTSVIMSPVPSETSQPWAAERVVFNSSPLSSLSTSSHPSLLSSPNSSSSSSASSPSSIPPTAAFLPNPFMLRQPALSLQQSPPPPCPPTIPMVMYPFLSSNLVYPLRNLFLPGNHVQPATFCPIFPSNTLVNYIHKK